MSDRRDRLPPMIRDQYDQIVSQSPDPLRAQFAEKLFELFDETFAAMDPEVRDQYDKIMEMPPSSMRDDLATKVFRIGIGDHDHFDWNGTPVRVACAGSAVETFIGGTWRPGGPSYTVRQEECEALTQAELNARYPATRRAHRIT